MRTLSDDKGLYTVKPSDVTATERQTLAILIAMGKSPDEAVELIRKAEEVYTESELSKKRSRITRERDAI